MEERVVIGVVRAPHGVRGTLRVSAPGSGRHLREGVRPLVDGERRRIVRVRKTPKGFLVDLEGVESRDAAAALRGAELALERTELDELGPEEFYFDELIGLRAVEEGGAPLGEVVGVLENPAHETLVIRDGGREVLVPFVSEQVLKVDLEKGVVIVRLLPSR
ncbi:16S rRNA processing protein RimM [Rubrobacter taiwanensis]|uniref:Ribosome maturation factor RimM n=1 Tax=Rubrobacter taiwanensis TaxID=185139 RepID=A0A4R1BHP5_9ACTN|nr:16S rRNA processing protein RimM [Rubrobacter taiwanensis]